MFFRSLVEMVKTLFLSLLAISSTSAKCLPRPVNPGCNPVGDPRYICYIEHLWLIDGRFYAADVRAEPLVLEEDHTDSRLIVHPLSCRTANAAELWRGGLTVIHHRIFPHNYAHAIRDTLPHDLFAFRRFHTETWDASTIRQNLRLFYVDGVHTKHAVYRVHSQYPPLERAPHDTGGVNMYFERAVLGHWGSLPLDTCHSHFWSPSDWDQYGRFIAQSVIGAVPAREISLIWIVNRGRGETRELEGGETLAQDLEQQYGLQVIHTRPDVPWTEQIRLARRASIIMGPHGSNLANAILAGPNASVVELLDRKHNMGTWYYQQCVYQGSRWVSFPNRSEDVPDFAAADAETIAPQLRLLLEHAYLPVFQHDFGHPSQFCS